MRIKVPTYSTVPANVSGPWRGLGSHRMPFPPPPPPANGLGAHIKRISLLGGEESSDEEGQDRGTSLPSTASSSGSGGIQTLRRSARIRERTVSPSPTSSPPAAKVRRIDNCQNVTLSRKLSDSSNSSGEDDEPMNPPSTNNANTNTREAVCMPASNQINGVLEEDYWGPMWASVPGLPPVSDNHRLEKEETQQEQNIIDFDTLIHGHEDMDTDTATGSPSPQPLEIISLPNSDPLLDFESELIDFILELN